MSVSAQASERDPVAIVPAAPRRAALVVAAPIAYLAALVAFTLSWGLPLARDQLFLWILLGLGAVSVPAWRTWGALLMAWLPFLGLLVAYDYLREAVAVTPAHAHVVPQIDVDRWLGGGAVPTHWLQAHLWGAGGPRWYDYGVWAVYMTHFFAVWVVAAAVWRASRRRFAHYAALTVTLTMGAFVVYWLYPAQPPWLAAEGNGIGSVARIVPVVWDHLGVATMQSVYDNGDLVNTVAAMPSLHAAYPAMLLLFFWGAGRRVRLGLALYTLAMGFTLVYSGEHFVSDVLAGWALAAAAHVLVGAAVTGRRRVRARAAS